jgi:hypothetical protein
VPTKCHLPQLSPCIIGGHGLYHNGE